ncbi:tyrosine-type recombinase/integrase [Simiduia aestuariiviva]|uniref:Integrase n=1 Tax=Simiduia aestuariiviva TaxID=1510459 RepID=A0A839UVS5_9GAMM|nr:integrase family protein [Simiduia aestuariiviva]MBB3170166.1 integrase [Simiduia aestuariiviva]
MSETHNFTKALLDELQPIPGKTRSYFYDKRINGLCLSITPKGTKSFLVYRKVEGKPVRVTLGRYPDMKIEQARKLAMDALSSMAGGTNLIEEKRAARSEGVTLSEAMADYLRVRGHTLSPNTISNYKTVLDRHLANWANKPLNYITRDRVARHHRTLSETSESAANKSMRVLRALFNFANGQYEDRHGRGLFPDNPVSRLTHTRSWNKETRRDNKIKNSQLASWFQAIESLYHREDLFTHVAADYLQFVLLTGLRRREAAGLNVGDLDFRDKTFTVHKTKNGHPLTLPMSDNVLAILKRRAENTSGEMVFESSGSSGQINDPRRIIDYIREASGVHFTIHDLRRTFISIAESLDIPAYALKRLVNHSTGGDVTAGYIIMDVERLRVPMQKISDFINQTAANNTTGIPMPGLRTSATESPL